MRRVKGTRLETSARYGKATSHMTEGWYATGLLAPLWGRVGGRDRLAAKTGIQGGTLSGYNTGRLRLGLVNAERIAAALDISIMDLGAPEARTGEEGQVVVVRLEGLAEKLAETMEELVRLQARVKKLEGRQAPGRAAPTRSQRQ